VSLIESGTQRFRDASVSRQEIALAHYDGHDEQYTRYPIHDSEATNPCRDQPEAQRRVRQEKPVRPVNASLIGHAFAQLTIQAVEDIDAVDLLLASHSFLEATKGKPNPDKDELARTMAYRACDWAVFDTADTYA
jgi:hypothetical protein